MASLMQALVKENPMLVEIGRFKRRFFETGKGRAVSLIVLSVAGLAYASLLLVIARFAGDIDPVGVVFVQTAVFALMAPAMTHGAIAGERDRRSWDLLLAAPITSGQIVVGKFLAALTGLAFAWLVFLVPTLLAAATYRPWLGHPGRGAWEMVLTLAQQEAVSVSFGVLVVAMTLFFSARSKRAFSALAASVGAMFLWMFVTPALVAMASIFDVADLALFTHPFAAIARLDSSSLPRAEEPLMMPSIPQDLFGFPQAALYILATIAFVLWAKQTLTLVDRGAGGNPVA